MKPKNFKKVLIVVIIISISTIFFSEMAICKSSLGQEDMKRAITNFAEKGKTREAIQEGKAASTKIVESQQDLKPFATEHLGRFDFDNGTLEGWILKEGANAIMKLKISQLEHVSGSSSLQLDVNATENNKVGEAFVKIPRPPLTNCVVVAKIKPSSDCAGPESCPNGIILFVRDNAGRGKFGMWRNLHAGEWREIAVSVNLNAVPLGAVDEGFDPNKIETVGVLFKLNEAQPKDYSCAGKVFVDDVKIVRDGKGLDTAEAIPLRVGNSWAYRRTVKKQGARCWCRLLPCKDGRNFETIGTMQDHGITEERYEITSFDPTDGYKVSGAGWANRNHRYSNSSSVWWKVEKSDILQGEGCAIIFERIQYDVSHIPGWGEDVKLPSIEERPLVFLWADFSKTLGIRLRRGSVDNGSQSVPETVQVPAGRFENCIEMVETYSDEMKDEKVYWQIFSYYCPGVGLVYEKGVNQDGEIIYEMELVGYSFK